MSFQHGAITDQTCDQCGYALRGLPVGSKCPECGHSSVHRSPAHIRDATMSAQAPAWYVRRLRYGFLLCMLSIIGGLSGPVIFALGAGSRSMLFPVALTGFVLISACWTAGVWLITRSRTGLGNSISHDPILDNKTLVYSIRLLSFAWPTWISLIVGAAMMARMGTGGGPLAANPMLFVVLVALAGVTAWIGLIPACVYFAELSYWASDERLVNRLRGTAWVMTVAGILAVVSRFLILTPLPIATPAKIVNVWATIACFLATIHLFYCMFRMSLLLNWVLSHQRITADKHARLATRLSQQHNNRAVHSARTPCDSCGYDLSGLPMNGRCPECGSQFGEGGLTFPVRDPARDRPRHDDTPIHVDEDSPHHAHKYNRPLGIPLEDLPEPKPDDLNDIPLADEA